MRHCIEREPAIAEERDPAVTGGKPCCWPIGHPGTFGFRFCEAAALIGKPDRPEHAELAYVPNPQPPRGRARGAPPP